MFLRSIYILFTNASLNFKLAAASICETTCAKYSSLSQISLIAIRCSEFNWNRPTKNWRNFSSTIPFLWEYKCRIWRIFSISSWLGSSKTPNWLICLFSLIKPFTLPFWSFPIFCFAQYFTNSCKSVQFKTSSIVTCCGDLRVAGFARNISYH